MAVTQGLDLIYPADSIPLYPEETDAFLTDIPRTAVFNTPDQLIAAPGAFAQLVEWDIQTIRDIETKRRLFAGHVSVYEAVLEKSPQTIEGLPEQLRGQVMELISRLQPDTKAESASSEVIHTD